MVVIEYPKQLYLRGWEDLTATVVVNGAAEEAAARGDGFRSLAEPPDVSEPDKVANSSITEDGHAKRGPGRPRKAD